MPRRHRNQLDESVHGAKFLHNLLGAVLEPFQGDCDFPSIEFREGPQNDSCDTFDWRLSDIRLKAHPQWEHRPTTSRPCTILLKAGAAVAIAATSRLLVSLMNGLDLLMTSRKNSDQHQFAGHEVQREVSIQRQFSQPASELMHHQSRAEIRSVNRAPGRAATGFGLGGREQGGPVVFSTGLFREMAESMPGF